MVSCETTEGAVLSVNLPRAKAHLSELIENGEDVVITRRGPIEPPKQPIDFEALEEFRKTQPPWPKSSAELIREMRDDDSY